MRFKRIKPGEYENAETGLRLSRTIHNGWAAWSPANESRERVQIAWGQSTKEAAEVKAVNWWNTVGSKEPSRTECPVNMPTTPEYRVLQIGPARFGHLTRRGTGTGLSWRTMCDKSWPVTSTAMYRSRPLDLTEVDCLACLDAYTEETRPSASSMRLIARSRLIMP